MQVTIISDCSDSNARSRQEIRYKALLGINVGITFVGAETSLEASGCLIDAIDAYQDTAGIIVVNVAHRGNKDIYPNGIPFCYSKVGNLNIVGTPNCFSLAKKLGIIENTNETDVFTVCKEFLPEAEAQRIASSQFRSYEYLPYLVKWISEGKEIISKEVDVHDFEDKNYIWYVDCFGNCKTTILFKEGAPNQKPILDYPFIEKLTDVPKNNEPYFIKGSSGYKDKRFIELVIQRQSASKILGIGVGAQV
jgi:hypothetical protein